MKTGPLPVDWEPGMSTIDVSTIDKIEFQQVPYYQYGFNSVLLAAKTGPADGISASNTAGQTAASAGAVTAVSAGTGTSFSPIVTGTFSPGFHSGIMDYFSLGRFKDSVNDSNDNLANPYTDPANCQWFLGCTDDREAYYTGGEPGTLIHVTATRHGNPADDFGGVCSASIIIPPEEHTCVDLKVTADPALKENTPTTFTVTPTFKDPSKPIPLNYYWNASEQKEDGSLGRFDFDLFTRSRIGRTI